jgi:cullin-4
MKPSQSSHSETPPLPSDISTKRKLYSDHGNDPSSSSQIPPPIPCSHEGTPKRLKLSSSSGSTAVMSKVMGRMSQARAPGDMVRTVPSGFEPHKGAKVLKIKNLRTTQKVDIEEYYDRTWSQLDAAVMATFNGRPTALPLDVLCRGVEATCRRGRADKLASHLKERCKTHLEKEVLPVIERDAGTSNVEALRAVYSHWITWNAQSVSDATAWYWLLIDTFLLRFYYA